MTENAKQEAGREGDRPSSGSDQSNGLEVPDLDSRLGDSTPSSPSSLSRNTSVSNVSALQDDWEAFLPPESVTAFDILGNFSLPAQLEKWQSTLAAQTEKVRRQREKLRLTSMDAKDRMVKEWRRRVPPEEQLDKYKTRMLQSVDQLNKKWEDTMAVTAREKLAFIAGVLNIFICGYLIGAFPEKFYIWFTIQFFYFIPVRCYLYHKRGYHYFVADLCYFVNGLLLLSIWVAPRSKRLFISTYCLAYGNNAIAIAMWRNSLVFHSLDKITSLFIHLMPPVTLHCIVHLTPITMQKARFPAVYHILYSSPSSPQHYSLGDMMVWMTIPYTIWQLSYHFLISVRRRDKIAAGRPTSFTYLKKSYSKTAMGKLILRLPSNLQEPAFMSTQYLYAIATMIPCPLWFWYREASTFFLMLVFSWSIYNGATFYIDVFGKRFERELEQMKKDVARWQASPKLAGEDGATGADAGNTPQQNAGKGQPVEPLDMNASSEGKKNS